MTFAEALDGLLVAGSMSNRELARRADVDPAQVGRWRRGWGLPRPSHLPKLAAVFGVDYEWLLGIAYPNLPPSSSEPDELEVALRARMEEMRAQLQGVPRPFWSAIVKAMYDTGVNMAQIAARSASEAGTVRTAQDAAHKKAKRRAKSAAEAGDDQITPVYPVATAALATP